MEEGQLIPDLYRHEYSKMVSVLCSRWGIGFMSAAADIVSETFLSAAETWGQKGVPANPVAWLYTVAKNNALNTLKHDRIFEQRIRGELLRAGLGDAPGVSGGQTFELDLSPRHITDSQLQMLFAVCHPSIPVEAQISLALRILCGFTIDEIAQALLTTKATINKRLYRAKEKLRAEKVAIALPDSKAIGERLDTVLLTLYLLFNEGYYSASPDKILRKDFCLEAMRLVYFLTEQELTALPRVYALLALMCFQASRFDARLSESGNLVLYEQQDSGLWDTELIRRGNAFFVQACAAGGGSGGGVSRYHMEAAIAWWHTHSAPDQEKWEQILRLYNQLLMLEYSPMAALNRAYAYFRVYGKEKAIREAEKLGLSGNLFYHSLLGELYAGLDDTSAVRHLTTALELAGTEAERAVLRWKLDSLRAE